MTGCPACSSYSDKEQREIDAVGRRYHRRMTDIRTKEGEARERAAETS